MRKFRTIKNRQLDQQVDNDLRGIGNDPLIQSAFPIAILFVESNNEKNIHKLCKDFELKIHAKFSQSNFALSVMAPAENSHKKDCLNLLYAALYLCKESEGNLASLEIIHPFHEMMKNSISNKVGKTFELQNTKHLQGQVYQFYIDIPSSMALEQAGLNIKVNEKGLKHDEVRTIVSTLLNSNSKTNLRKIIG